VREKLEDTEAGLLPFWQASFFVGGLCKEAWKFVLRRAMSAWAFMPRLRSKALRAVLFINHPNGLCCGA
jgi:hypothetical protein